PEIPAAIPQTFRLYRGCPGLLRPLLHLVQPGSPSRRYRLDDPGPGALRPGQRRPCRPSGRPGAGIPSQPGTLRAQSPRAAAYADPDLDQPTPDNRHQPSLNRDLGCLKVIDTFRSLADTAILLAAASQGLALKVSRLCSETDEWVNTLLNPQKSPRFSRCKSVGYTT